ncbi:hypothetical protein C349_01571 [Cryptococcus neoformans var. grubii Br795]|uniref:Uncharacterized protein n=1 Tax=Cryptococcus neoformans Tu259-1 TaxID=1230072 RepID=A0A854QJF2_CRYNE|nr:hypothetical protein C353_01494 [Cryptococcus neoformans var. grubii AD1-83a]OXG26117.1 hypothetical protein C361_01474 [Cryptococcus neoformans var. grubii Tu259-1]OXG53015.1 hypothetical protein C355_01580 [Cryptococcus neoformans var. grubii Th84]OXG65491.1 hypothetical protein C354_01505 [Cryptococcus neoformans var. grubii MW-RSA1955]OXG67459.1 hypothetical protein C351_01332 [Cryptococcus neoformans var. grubii c8]OXG70491.1 hypothetical protein C352_01511 [Cryptococcus neoformans var
MTPFKASQIKINWAHALPPSSSLTSHVLNQCLSWLDKVSENATKKAPATYSGMFKAVVMSTGGIVSRETADEMRRWRKEMGPAAFEGMMRKSVLNWLEQGLGHLRFYSLGDRDARSTVTPCTPNSKLADFSLDRCINWLDKVGQVVAKNTPKVAL